MPEQPRPRLPSAALADLFAQLAVMEEAGLPAAGAFQTLADAVPGTAMGRAARAAAAAAGRGERASAAGRRSGLFTGLEAKVVAVAESVGSPAAAFRRLAERHQLTAARTRRLRSHLAMPILVGVIASFAAPLPALLAAELSWPGYLGRALLPAVAVAGALLGVRSMLARGAAPGGSRAPAVDAAVLALPLLGAVQARREAWRFLDGLALLLGSGADALTAAREASKAVGNRTVREDLRQASAALESGATFTESCGSSRFISDAVRRQMHAGEAAGRLPETLARVAEAEGEALASFDDQVATWVPRLLYFALAGWILSGVIGFWTGRTAPG